MRSLICVLALGFGLIPLFAADLSTQGLKVVSCSVEAVQAGEFKIVLLVSGEGVLLLSKKPDANGNAQSVSVPLDHAAIVLHRTHEGYPNDGEWTAACRSFQSLFGKKVSLETVSPDFSFHDGDLQMISVTNLRIVK